MDNNAQPTTFGKYRIIQRIAVGGMAEIFQARIDGIGGFQRNFAIKRILPHLSDRSDFVDMLVDEAKIAGLLSHANIVQILDLGQVDGAYYIAMEFIDGSDLGKILAKCKDKGITLPVPHAVFITIEILKGLEYAHNRKVMRGGRAVPLNIVHRDVAPSNILISNQGEIKITDFGIAKASVKALETVSGIVKGRFDYFSPEQAMGKQVDQRSDLFAAGVLLFHMLTGVHPFRKGAESETIAAIRNGSYPPPTNIRPDIPYSLEVTLKQALDKDPNKRFQSATAMKASLDKFFHEAGFIFSHATLSTFNKGLMGTRAPPNRALPKVGARFPDQFTNPLIGEDTDDVPTTIENTNDSGAKPTTPDAEPLKIPIGADFSRSQPLGPLMSGIDESTVSRDDNPNNAQMWSDAETAIRQVGKDGSLVPSNLTPNDNNSFGGRGPGAPAPADSGLPRGPTLSQGGSGTDQRRRNTRRPQRPPPSRKLPLLYLLLSVVGTVIILFVGFFLGMRAANLSPNKANQGNTRRNATPIIEIRDLPNDVTLSVDGRLVTAPFPRRLPMESKTPHVVKLNGTGYQPLTTTVELEPGEIRVLSFQLERLKEEK